MADYIESETVIKIVTKIMCDTKVRHKGRAINRNIKQLSTADVQEVRHAKWIGRHDDDSLYDDWYCSECGYYSDVRNKKHLGNYCSYCGAKMDKE